MAKVFVNDPDGDRPTTSHPGKNVPTQLVGSQEPQSRVPLPDLVRSSLARGGYQEED